MVLDRIRFVIGKKKPVEWDMTKLERIELPLIGPVQVSWTFRQLLSDRIEEYIIGMYWEHEQLIQLEAVYLNTCAPLLFSGQPIAVSGETYIVNMLEGFTLPPSRIFSPFIGQVSYSFTGWAGFRYLIEKE